MWPDCKVDVLSPASAEVSVWSVTSIWPTCLVVWYLDTRMLFVFSVYIICSRVTQKITHIFMLIFNQDIISDTEQCSTIWIWWSTFHFFSCIIHRLYQACHTVSLYIKRCQNVNSCFIAPSIEKCSIVYINDTVRWYGIKNCSGMELTHGEQILTLSMLVYFSYANSPMLSSLFSAKKEWNRLSLVLLCCRDIDETFHNSMEWEKCYWSVLEIAF